MRYLLRFNLFVFLCSTAFSQVEHVKIEKEENPLIPHIAEIYDGQISYIDLCTRTGIQSSESYKVDSFKIEYSGNEVLVKGFQIPDSICAYIAACEFNQCIFITDIFASNSAKQRIKLFSLSLVVIKDEDN